MNVRLWQMYYAIKMTSFTHNRDFRYKHHSLCCGQIELEYVYVVSSS